MQVIHIVTPFSSIADKGDGIACQFVDALHPTLVKRIFVRCDVQLVYVHVLVKRNLPPHLCRIKKVTGDGWCLFIPLRNFVLKRVDSVWLAKLALVVPAAIVTDWKVCNAKYIPVHRVFRLGSEHHRV